MKAKRFKLVGLVTIFGLVTLWMLPAPIQAVDEAVIQQQVRDLARQRQQAATLSGQLIQEGFQPRPAGQAHQETAPAIETELLWQSGPIGLWKMDGQLYLSIWGGAVMPHSKK